MIEPLVSVIIPTYKRAYMLKRAIDSTLNQTYSNIEIIVVDDNGLDTQEHIQTRQIINLYGDKLKYIVHKENKGGSSARNTGWRESRGEYITFLDDDDEISPTKIEKQVKKLEQKDDSFGACYTAYHILMKNGKVQSSGTIDEGNVYLQALARNFYMGSGSNLLIRKKYVDQINGYDEEFKRNQDIEFMARLFQICKVAYVNESLLTIHMEVRQFKRTFIFDDQVTEFYLKKMKSRIEDLEDKDKKKIYAIIALDRSRVALKHHKLKNAYNILKKVPLVIFIRYCVYLFLRIVKKKSYGFFFK